jgi:hypothetical protein
LQFDPAAALVQQHCAAFQIFAINPTSTSLPALGFFFHPVRLHLAPLLSHLPGILPMCADGEYDWTLAAESPHSSVTSIKIGWSVLPFGPMLTPLTMAGP